eukprot:419-Heterococcus_DN1.PRE.2
MTQKYNRILRGAHCVSCEPVPGVDHQCMFDYIFATTCLHSIVSIGQQQLANRQRFIQHVPNSSEHTEVGSVGSSGKKTVWTAAAVVAAVDCCCCTPACPCSSSSEKDGHYLIEKDQTESLRK